MITMLKNALGLLLLRGSYSLFYMYSALFLIVITIGMRSTTFEDSLYKIYDTGGAQLLARALIFMPIAMCGLFILFFLTALIRDCESKSRRQNSIKISLLLSFLILWSFFLVQIPVDQLQKDADAARENFSTYRLYFTNLLSFVMYAVYYGSFPLAVYLFISAASFKDEHVPRANPLVSRILLLASLIITASLIFIYLNVLKFDSKSGALIFILAAYIFFGLSAIAVHLQFRGFLHLPSLISVITLAFLISPSKYYLPSMADSSELTKTDIIEKFDIFARNLDSSCSDPAACEIDYYVFSAPGGGIIAAHSTSRILNKLRSTAPELYNRIFAFSGVSGGSVGIAHHHLLAEYSDISNYKDIEEAERSFFSADWISPVIWTAAGPSLLQAFLPFDLGEVSDRGYALERSIQKSFKMSLPEVRGDGFDGALSSLAPERVIVFSGVLEHRGDRVFISNSNVPKDWLGEDLSLYIDDRKEISIAGAVATSSAFPIMTPPASFSKGKLKVVDGGFFDNSGLSVSYDLIQHVRRFYPKVRAHLISVRYASIEHKNVDLGEFPNNFIISGDIFSAFGTAFAVRRALEHQRYLQASEDFCDRCYQTIEEKHQFIYQIHTSSKKLQERQPAKDALEDFDKFFEIIAKDPSFFDKSDRLNEKGLSLLRKHIDERIKSIQSVVDFDSFIENPPHQKVDLKDFEKFLTITINDIDTRLGVLSWSSSSSMARQVEAVLPDIDRCDAKILKFVNFASLNTKEIYYSLVEMFADMEFYEMAKEDRHEILLRRDPVKRFNWEIERFQSLNEAEREELQRDSRESAKRSADYFYKSLSRRVDDVGRDISDLSLLYFVRDSYNFRRDFKLIFRRTVESCALREAVKRFK